MLLPKDQEYVDSELPEPKFEKVIEKQKRTEKISEIFALFASIITIIAFLFSVFGESKFREEISNFFQSNQQLFEIILGIIGSLIASMATFFTAYLSKKRTKKNLARKESAVEK